MKVRKIMVTILFVLTALFGSLALVACGDTEINLEEGPETGEYYYEVQGENKEYTISLHDGNKVDFKVKEYDLTGTYTVEGTEVTFTFEAEPNTVSASLRDDVLNVTLGGDVMRFLKKVSYTVKYMSEGAEYKTETVVNGKTATCPAENPSKDNFIFIAWYTDAATYRNLYDFTQPVRGDVTLYARFVEPVDPEFTVTLDYNGGDVTGPAEVETTGRKLFTLPKPTRTGYEFAGWWVSQSGSADKLTYRYTEEQTIDQPLTLYAVWDDGKTPLVSIYENGVSWTAKGVNNSYNFKFTGPDGVIVEQSLSTSSYSYDFAQNKAGEYTAEVTLNGNTGRAYFNNKALVPVSVWNVEGSVFMWNSVPNAEKYIVDVKCADPNHVHSGEVAATDELKYDFSSCGMPEDGIIFTVTASAEGYASSVSEEFVYTRTLDPVTDVAVDEATAVLSWKAVEGAAAYTVSVLKEGASAAETEEVSADTLTYSLKTLAPGKYTVSVKPSANGWLSPAATAYTYDKVRLATPSNIHVEGMTLTWDASDGADGYIVTVNGTPHTVSENSFPLSGETVGDGVEVSVVATKSGNDAITSPASDALKITSGNKMGGVRYAAGSVSWDAVLGVSDFVVKVNDNGEEQSATGTSLAVSLTKKGENVIYVCGVLEDGSRTDWAQCTVTAYAVELQANFEGARPVESRYYAEGDPVDLGTTERTGYKFDGWYTLGDAGDPYTAKTFTGNTDITLYAHWTARTFTITLNPGTYGTLEKSTITVTYDQNYTIQCPESINVTKAFAAWRTQPNGSGIAYTNFEGGSLFVWRGVQDITLYAEWVEIFKFTYNKDTDSFSVSKGEGIEYVRSVTIPEEYGNAESGGNKYVLSIDDFSGCKLLEEISFPARIKNIGLGGTKHVAFMNCTNLHTLKVYQGKYQDEPIYETENGALLYNNDATSMKEIVFLPAAYLSHFGVSDYEIPDGVQYIPSKVFEKVNFSKVTIPASVKVIETEAFSECTAVKEIVFKNAAEGEEEPIDIREKAFSKLTGLLNISLPARLKDFSPKILYKCTALTAIKLEKSSNGYKTTTADDGVEGVLLKDEGSKTILVYYPNGIDTFIVPKGVTSIGSEAVVREPKYDTLTTSDSINDKFESVTIPSYVTEIQDGAFKDCRSLKELIFEGDAKSNGLNIGKQAFMNCPLTAIELPANIKRIEEQAFYSYTSGNGSYVMTVKDVTLPVGLEYVGKAAFGNIKTLTSVTVNTECDDKESPKIFAVGAFGSMSANAAFYVTEVTLSDKTFVQLTDVFGNNIETVNISDQNEYYAKDQDVLFNRKMDMIVYYPKSKVGPFDLPATVSVIPANLFKGNLNLTGITIPATVTSIGAGAFTGCKNLAYVTFTDTVVENGAPADELDIGASAFSGCDLLKDIELPARTRSIGDSCFAASSRMKGLTSVTLNEGLESIGMEAFKNTALTEVNIPATVTDMGLGTNTSYVNTPIFSVFYLCDALEKITVTDGGTAYDDVDGILYKLGDVILTEGGVAEKKPTELLYVPQGYRNESKTIEIPNTVNKIWALSFYYYGVGGSNVENPDANIETVKFQNNSLAEVWNAETSKMELPVLTVDPKAFMDCGPIRTISFPEGYRTFQSYTIVKGSRAMPLTTIELPATLTQIEGKAIYGGNAITSLKTVSFRAPAEGKAAAQLVVGDPAATQATTGNVFYGCSNLDSIALPEGTVEIGAYAFGNSSSANAIRSVTIPSTVTKIGKYAFSGLVLDRFEFQSGDAASLEIGEYAFSKVTGLSDMALTTATTIASNAFANSSLSSVTFGDSLKTIDLAAFRGTRLSGVLTFPAGIQTIGQSAFEGLTGITEVRFTKPATVPAAAERLTIKSSAFSGCIRLNKINLEDSTLATLERDAFRNTAISSITFPWTITTIGMYAFENLSSLKEIKFATDPEQNGGKTCLKEIEGYAFNFTGITSFSFPNSSEDSIKLGQKLFVGCSSLSEVYLSSQVVKIDNVFNGCGSIGKITVEQGHPNFSSKEGQTILFDATGNSVFLVYAELASGAFEVAEGATEIGSGAFKGQTEITSLKLPASLMYIGDEAFIDCINLKSVTFNGDESQLQSIGASAFKNCINLETIELEKTSMLRTTTKAGSTAIDKYGIGANAFENCYKLQTVDLSRNNGITQLATKTFLNAGRDTTDEHPFTVTLPSTITFLNTYTFQNSGLRTIDLSALDSLKGLQSAATATTGTGATYLFEGCTKLTEVQLPENVLYIGAYVFHGCTALKTINLGKVQYIGSHTFEGCIALTGDQPDGFGSDPSVNPNLSVDLSALTKADTYAFAGSGVIAVEFQPAFATIGTYAFFNCKSLQSVVFSGGTSKVTSIATNAFQDCAALTEILIPSSVTSIGTAAFAGTGLTKITIPNTVTTVGKAAFFKCEALTDVKFESKDSANNKTLSITAGSIGNKQYPGTDYSANGAFESSGVENIEWGDRITTISARMFHHCKSLTATTIPSCVTTINDFAFADTGLKSFFLPKTVTKLVTSTQASGYARQFANCVDLASFTFEEGCGVNTVSVYMFEGCTSLEKFSIPAGVTEIPNGMYKDTGLKSLGAEDWKDVTTVGRYAFQGSKLTSVTIPGQIVKFKNNSDGNPQSYAFADCADLETVTFEADEETGLTGLTCLEGYLFVNCPSLRSVKFADGITNFGIHTFDDCKNLVLTADDLPDSVTTLDAGISKLLYEGQEDIVIDDKFTSISGGAFAGWVIHSIKFPETLTSIVKVNLGSSTDLSSAFRNTTIETDLVLPKTMTELGAYTFRDANLQKVTLPENLTTLGDNLFDGSTVKSVVLPRNLLYIGGSTFQNCTELTSVDFNGNTVIDGFFKWSSNKKADASGTFKGCTSLTTIDLPASMTYLGGTTFQNSGLERIDLSKLTNLKHIASGSTTAWSAGNSGAIFQNCKQLTEVIMPPNLEYMTCNVFDGCEMLSKIELPETLTKIGTTAFQNTAITSIKLPALEDLGTGLFTGCSALEEVELTDGITKLTKSMFLNCTSLRTINIPASVTTIDATTFQGCGSLALTEDMLKSDKLTLSGDGQYLVSNGTVYAYAKGGTLADSTLTVTASDTLNQYMFRGAKIKKIEFQEGVTTIPAYAFYGVEAEEVVIPASVSKISEYAFQASTIGKIVLPETLGTIGYKSFADATIKDITVNSKNAWTYTDRVGSYYQNTSVFTNAVIEKITIAEGVTIGQNWFENATLPEVFDLSGVVTIDTKAFTKAKPAGKIVVPTSVTTIGLGAFSGVPAAQVEFDLGEGASLTIADGKSASDSLFGTAEAVSVSLPGRLIHLGNYAFAGSTTLTTVKLGVASGLVIGSSVFEGCTALESIVIPEGVTEIGSKVFKGCTSLSSVKLPETLLTIGANAFEGCTELKSLYIPSKVASMPTSVFTGWDGSHKLYAGMSRFTFFQLFGSDLYLTSGMSIEFDVTAERYGEIAAAEQKEKEDADQGENADAEPGKEEGAED